MDPHPPVRTLSQVGCIIWGVVALVVMVISVGLLIYIDQRFGAQTSAFFLGLFIGIPFLLLVALILGGIYVLIVRGTAHLQQQDDAGEIERMRTLRDLARFDRAQQRQLPDPTAQQQRLIDAWRQQEPPSNRSRWGEDEDGTSRNDNDASYRILE